jgi:hypothetical protein
MRQREKTTQRSKIAEERILFALEHNETGQLMADRCRCKGISESMYCVRTKYYANVDLLEASGFKHLQGGMPGKKTGCSRFDVESARGAPMPSLPFEPNGHGYQTKYRVVVQPQC